MQGMTNILVFDIPMQETMLILQLSRGEYSTLAILNPYTTTKSF